MPIQPPKDYTICYLRWLNKILKPFKDFNKQNLSETELAKYFSAPGTTNFKCYLRLALDFEMIIDRNLTFSLSSHGMKYISNFNPDIDRIKNLSSVDITETQRIILLDILTNGNWTAHKANIYWFLKFIEETKGEWLPNIKDFEKNKLDFVNRFFNVHYRSRTMYEFLNFACNWCMELGLVNRIEDSSNYDKVSLTLLGIKTNNTLISLSN